MGFFFALFRPLGSIRAFFSPYCRWQYGLFFRPISPVGLNTGFWRPISPVGNTGFFSPYFARWAQYGLLAAIARWAIRRLPGVALRLPRAVFWRPFRALIPIAKSTTPATSGVYSPLHAINARHDGRLCTKLYINPTK